MKASEHEASLKKKISDGWKLILKNGKNVS